MREGERGRHERGREREREGERGRHERGRHERGREGEA